MNRIAGAEKTHASRRVRETFAQLIARGSRECVPACQQRPRRTHPRVSLHVAGALDELTLVYDACSDPVLSQIMEPAAVRQSHSVKQAAGDGHDALAYQSGFGNEFATEALAGALPRRAELAAARALWPVCRAALRHRLHRAARRQPPLLAVSDPARGGARPFRAHRRRRASSAAFDEVRRRRPTSCAGTRCRSRPTPTDFVEGLVTMAGNGDVRGAERLRHPPVRRQPLDARTASSTTPTASC